MRLKDKTAVIYGAAGSIGAAAARAFAREGAKVFLTGRSIEKLKRIAGEISPDYTNIEIAEIDALDEKAVKRHLETVVEKSGHLDISFNAIGIPQTGVQGIPLIELSTEQFFLPASTYLKSHFMTATAAAKLMAENKSGVILFHTPEPARIAAPLVGGMSAAWAAMESLSRNLSIETAEQGIRTITVRTTGIPETPTIDEVFDLHARAMGISREQFQEFVENMSHTKHSTTLKEFANALIYAASDDSKGMTGAVLNLTGGIIAD